MCKKFIFLSLLLTFALTVSAQATTIIWVSDDKADDGTDQGWIDLLVDNGYTVNLDFRTREGRTLDAAEIAALNAADLVIFSRDTSSGDYNGATEIAQWNGITTPLICMSAYQYRSSRWIWMNSTSTGATTAPLLAVIPEHPIFDGVTLDGSNQVAILTAQSNVGDDNVDPTNNYTLIATRSDAGADGVWIATWETGVEFYPGSGQYAGGPRMYFAGGGSEGDNVDGRYNFTPEGDKLFLNAVAYYTGPTHTATNPYPKDGADVPPEGDVEGGVFMILTFDPGDDAIAHTAYFSSNRDDVEGRVEDVNLGPPPFPVYMPYSYYAGLDDTNLPAFAQEPLDTGITYYWVVDEFNGVDTFPGTVWSFTIIPEQAWDPTPVHDAQNVIGDPTLTLSWQIGSADTDGHTVSYDVFYGTDEATVATATTPDAHVTVTTLDVGPLTGDTDYYWRVNTLLTDIGPPFETDTVEGDVWHFKTIFSVPEVDPNLVAWWKLDGGFGDLAFDWSGHANHGTLNGDPTFVPGKVDNALDFDGVDDIVVVNQNSGLPIYNNGIDNTYSIAMWVKGGPQPDRRVFSEGSTSNNNPLFNLGTQNGGATGQFDVYIRPTGLEHTYSVAEPFDDTWHHIAWVDANGTATLYVDGVLDGTDFSYTRATLDLNTTSIGGILRAAPSYFFTGQVDDVRVYKRSLSEKEVKILADRLGASDPDPANGATDVTRTPTLGWSPGAFVAAMNGNILYYDEDLNAVLGRTATSFTLTDPNYPLPTTLDLGATFYWRVDTANDVTLPGDVWPGDVWSFTTIDWLSVDDMEPYVIWSNPAGPHIFVAWRDGFGDCSPGNGNDTGAVLTEIAAPVFAGLQSMKYDYDNDGTVYSPCTMGLVSGHKMYSKIEAQIATLLSGIGTDWTTQGVRALSLRFYGTATNIVEPMWVQLQDATKGYGEKVTYGDYEDEDPNDITDEAWHEWFIDLADFDVDANNLVSMSIGFGNEDETGPHGSGTVYFDDFRLYTPKCFAARHSEELARVDFAPLGAPDCVVNYKELDVMADDWLLTDTLETGELLVRWQFDETAGVIANDASGNARHGDVNDVNGVSWTFDAERGRCLDFAGGDHVLDNDANTYLNDLHGLTISVWVKNRETTATDQGFIIFDDPIGNDDRDMRYDAEGANGGGTPSVIKCGVTTTATVGNAIQQLESSEYAQTTAWQHLALTWSTGEQLKLYIDGALDTPTANRPGTVGVTTGATKLIVGKGGKGNVAGGGWNGLIDDVQIYNYALSATEIATVKAGGAIAPKPVHYPVPSPAEIHEGEAQGSRAVNFKDYAELLDNWLFEIKYPR